MQGAAGAADKKALAASAPEPSLSGGAAERSKPRRTFAPGRHRTISKESPKEAKGAIAFRCAYSLENRIVDDYGQRLRVAWALDGPRGGVECDEHGAPIISPADEDTDHPNFERIRFYPPGLGFKGYEFIDAQQMTVPLLNGFVHFRSTEQAN